MKSPFGKLKKLGPNKGDPKENWDQPISVHVDALTQAAKDMKDMRNCYDSLLSAAAATANSAYEFSESLLEMGNCLLEKTTVHDDGESGEALSKLGKVQLELQKQVDSYRSRIITTITNPSESLLSELQKVEEMKLQCDEKREMFEYMVGQFREKGRSRHGKEETFTSQQLQVVREEYSEVARLCIFRVESLKQGQGRSLLTQAVRHHAAQLNFFQKGCQSLKAVEPHIKNVAEKQRIDYEICEVKGEEGDERNSFENNGNGELSFDYKQNKHELDSTSTLRNSMELDQLGAQSVATSNVKDSEIQINISRNTRGQFLSQQQRAGSHSAPIYADKLDPSDRIKEMRTAMNKLNTHVLPTPADAKCSVASSSTSLSSTMLPGGRSKNLWHSSPLDIGKQKKFPDNQLYVPGSSKSQVAMEDNNKNKHFLPLPRPPTEGATVPQFDAQSGFENRKVKRQAFSGPLASKPSSNKQIFPSSGPVSSTELPQTTSALLSSTSGPQIPAILDVSHSSSPPLASSPKFSELHELPRPPDYFSSKAMLSPGPIGHSAPLFNRNQELSPRKRNPPRNSKEGSPLPLPQLSVSRSFSIPSSSRREMSSHSDKVLGSPQIVQTREVVSPPLTPISLANMKSHNSG